MNIAFHYYAVKAITQSAGINPKDAQLIAEYSQFVDDFNWEKTIKTCWIPPDKEARDIGFAKYVSKDEYVMTTVKTGFWSNWDYLKMLDWKILNRLVVPFHFIPPAKLTENTPPEDTVTRQAQDGDFISETLKEALGRAMTGPVNNRRSALINLGMVLHVFADTYAHQHFSGQKNRELNGYKVANAVRFYPTEEVDVTKEVDVTTDYTGVATLLRPAIGHGMVDTAPDDTYLKFKVAHRDNSSVYFERNNIDCFSEAAETIYNMFARYTGVPAAFNAIREKLRKAFLIDNSERGDIALQWKALFRNVTFGYDRNSVFKRLIPGATLKLSDNEQPSDEQLTSVPNNVTEVTKEFFDFMVHAYKYRERAVDAAIR